MPNIVQSLRSVARLPFVRGNRPPIHTISVNIDLAFYNGAVPYANRTDRHFLNEVVPKVLADLEEAIEARFTIAGHSHSISNMRPTCTFELTNRAAITATVFDSRVSLQAFTNNRKVARSLRRLLTDFKLRKNYKYDTAELAKNLSPSFSGRRR